jgi:arylsulfatase A-like enzyme
MKPLLFLFSLLSISSLTTFADDTRPNIVFILIDDLGRQDLGVYGSTYHETPHIDQLAADGALFENAYACHAVCRPSRTGIFSGRSPVRYGIPGFQDYSRGKHAIPPEDDTIGDVFAKAGYATGYIGKWHIGRDSGGEPEKQGFQVSHFAGEPGQPVNFFTPYHVGWDKWQQPKKGMSYKAFTKEKPGPRGEYITDRLTDEAINFMENKKDQAFFLVLAHYGVHIPTQAPKDLIKKYKIKRNRTKLAKGDNRHEVKVLTDKTGMYKTVQNHPEYAAQVESIDQSVGRVVAKLRELDLQDNTIIVFSSDHGGFSSRGLNSGIHLPATNLPYRHGKGWLYDGGLRVPLIVKWPKKIKAGFKTNFQTTGTDHFASFLEMAGIDYEPTQTLDSTSYFGATQGNTTTRPPMFWHSPISRTESMGDTAASAIIDGNWKFIDWYEDEVVELYNLTADPGERQNLVLSHPEKAQELQEKLKTWKASVNARHRN